MGAELDYKTFDLAAVLAGRDYPETSVTVYFDEKLGFTINRLRKAIGEADRRDDEATAKDLQTELDGLVKKVANAKYTVHLRGISEGMKDGIFQTIAKDFPVKRDVFGQELPDPGADRAFTRKYWSAVIVRVEDPSGAVSLMSEELAQLLQDEAPKSAQEEINRGIEELTSGSNEGFEFAAREVDFLSIASPEG